MSVLTSSTLSSLFKEVLEIGSLNERDQAKYRLIGKYRHKVSQRLLDKRAELLKEAKRDSRDILKNIIYGKNPFLALIRKEEPFVGRAMPLYWGRS